MQNKPNLQKAEINLTSYEHKDYEKMRVREPRKNKPNQTQFQSSTSDEYSDMTQNKLYFPKNNS